MAKSRREFGNIQKLPSGKLRARYWEDGKWVNAPRTFTEPEAARNWLNEQQKMFKANVTPGELSANDTFNSWADLYLLMPRRRARRTSVGVSSSKSVNTTTDYESILKLHVRPFFGSTLLRDIDLQMIFDYQEWLEERLGNKQRTIVKAQKYTRWVLGLALELDAIPRNPFKHPRVTMPAEASRREPIFLEEDEVHNLSAQIHPHFAAVPLFTAYTGLRAGEVWALKCGAVDVLHKELTVTHSVSEVKNRGLVLGTTKNGRSRTIMLPEPVLKIASEQMKRINGGPDDWLFPSVNGMQMRHTNFMADYFAPAKEAAGIDPATRFHDLRHFCAHYHIGHGFEPYAIMQLLGHSSITVTMDIYGGLFRSLRREMADRVGKLMDDSERLRMLKPTNGV